MTGSLRPELARIVQWLETAPDRWSSPEMEDNAALPWPMVEELFDLGLFHLLVPETWGGLACSMGEFCSITASVAEYDISLAVTLVPHSGMGTKSVLLFGSEDQKRRILGTIAESRRFIAYAQTEPGAGSDFSQIRTTIRKRGDGKLVLSGSKIWITNAGWSKSIVVVGTCPDHSPVPGALAFVHLSGTEPGLRILHPYDKLAIKSSVTSELYFDDVILDEDSILGTPGRGLLQFNTLVCSGRMGVGATALGVLKRAAQEFRNCCPELRQDRDQNTLELAIDQMETLLWWAAPIVDQGGAEAPLTAGLAKVHCTEMAWAWVQRLNDKAGPRTYLDEHGLSQTYREAPILRITEGPNEVVLYRCALELVSGVPRFLTSLSSNLATLSMENHPLKEDWEALLATYTEFVDTATTNHTPFSGKQILLERVFRACLSLCLYGALVVRWSQRPTATPDARQVMVLEAAGRCRREIAHWCRPYAEEDALVDRQHH